MIEYYCPPSLGLSFHDHVFRKVGKLNYACACGRVLVDKAGA